MITRRHCGPLTLFLLVILGSDVPALTSAYTPQSRWGQACTIVSNTLYVHGGKLDSSNQFSYNSAPNTNDLLALDLSSPFLLSNPPWRVVMGSDIPSSSQGPAVSFHTLTAFSRDGILAFGGSGGPPMPIETYPDSAWLLANLTDPSGPIWFAQPSGWANEPMRRIYHAATAVDGTVWITGGEKADGSSLGFNTTYQYVPAGPSSSDSFNPMASGIPDMIGHGSVLLANGTLVLFGGYSPSRYAMLPLSQLWMFDTTSPSSSWTLVSVSGTIPSLRRNFAYALLDGSKVLIHGGSDASIQSAFSDGAILDLGSRLWADASGISSMLGPRHDHMAVGLGSQVMFAFGYTANGPAAAGLFIYDTLTGAFVSMFVPPSTSTLNNPPGLPSLSAPLSGGPSPTNAPGSSTGVSGSIAESYSTSLSGTRPTGTNGSLTSLTHRVANTPTRTFSRSPGSTVWPGPDSNSGDRSKNIIGIVVGSTLGTVALIILVTAAVLRNRRAKAWQHSQGHSHLVWTSEGFGGNGSDELPDSEIPPPHPGNTPPVAVSGWEPVKRRNSAWAVLGRGSKIPSNRNGKRFDILADEDVREFEDLGVYTGVKVNRQRSGNSEGSASAKGPNRRSSSGRSWTEVVNDGVSSVRSVGIAIGRKVSGGGGGARANNDWWEKDGPFLEDEARLLPDSTALDIGVDTTPVPMPSHSRSGEVNSTMHSQSSSYYRDPYPDGIEDEPLIAAQASGSNIENVEDAVPHSATETSNRLKEAYPVSSTSPQATAIPLSPVISGPSVHSNLSTGSQPQSSSGSSSTPMQSSSETHTTIPSAATTPLRRSDTWWSRIGRTSLRGGASDTSMPSSGTRRLSFRRTGPLSPTSDSKFAIDFRDPNPAPAPIRLHAIEESMNIPDESREKAGARDTHNQGSKEKPRVMPSAYVLHSQSTSSLQTAVTADSDMLERMGGKVPVIRRMQTESTTHSPTPSSSLSMSSSSEQRDMIVGTNNEIGEISPSAGTGGNSRKNVFAGPRLPPPSSRKSRFNLPPPDVSDRIAEYEQRTELAAEDQHPSGSKLSPVTAENTGGQDEKRGRARGNSAPPSARIEWGLAKRPSLFVANPDRRREDSGDISDALV